MKVLVMSKVEIIGVCLTVFGFAMGGRGAGARLVRFPVGWAVYGML